MPEINDQRAAAIEQIARQAYDDRAPRSAPAWDVADPMVRHAIMEQVNDSVNRVLAVFTPAAPEMQGLLMQLEMHMAELRRVPRLSGAQAAASLQAVIDLAVNYGEPKGD